MTGTTLFIIIAGALISAAVASGKQRNVGGWLIFGALLPVIAVIVVACLPSLAPSSTTEEAPTA